MSAIGLYLALSVAALGCPFCTALEPTLSSRRETAMVVALGEVDGIVDRQASIRVHRWLKGEKLLAGRQSIVVPSGSSLRVGTLVLVFGEQVESGNEDGAAGRYG